MKRKLFLTLSVLLTTALFSNDLWSQAGSVSVFSGIFNQGGGNDGLRLESRFDEPSGAVFDSKGNLYIVEFDGGRLRRVDKEGEVTTLTSGGYLPNGSYAAVLFDGPSDVIVAENDTLFISDQSGNKIRRVDRDGNVITLAGSVFGFRDAKGSQAQFRSPSDLALGSNGNIYVADQGNHRIRMVDREGNVTTILGDGTSQTRLGAMNQAVVASPRFIDFDKDGNLLIASQYDLYKLDFDNQELIHLIGQGTPNRFYDGFKAEAHFNDIKDLYVNEAGIVYIGDGRVLRQYTNDGYLVTVSGNMSNFSLGGNELGNAAYVDIKGLVQKGADSLFIVDQTRHVVYLARVNNGVTVHNSDITADVTWTKEASPHIIGDNITISSGVKLTIEPGAVIKRNQEAGVTVKGALSAVGSVADSIHISDGHNGNLFVGKYLFTFDEANLSGSSLAYLTAKPQSTRTTPLIRIGNEVTSRTTADIPLSGDLDIKNSYFNQVQILTDSRSSTASVTLKDSRLKNSPFFVLGKESVEIDKCLITNSDVKNDEKLTINNSTLQGVNLLLKNTNYSGSSVPLTIVKNSTLEESGVAADEPADFEISDSELINTAIHVSSGNLKISNIKSTLDKRYSRIRKPNGDYDYFSHFITAGSAQVNGLFLNTNDHKSGIYITGENNRNSESSLTLSTLKGDGGEALLQYKQEKELTITSANFISTGKMINNFSSKRINASGNYFNAFLDSAAIEQEIYHVVDNTSYGLVDFSNPSASRFFGPVILGPEVKFGRLFDSNYLDDVAIRFGSIDPKAEKLLVYKHNTYSPENLTFLGEVVAPFNPFRTPYEQNISYAVIAEDADGKQADIEYSSNKHLSLQIVGTRLTIDEDEEYDFQIKVIADPVDSVSVQIDENRNPNLFSNDDINISFLKEEGDTTFFNVHMKPLPEAFGFAGITFRATNGITSQFRSISQNVRKINEFKPVIEGVDPVTGLFTDRSFEISHTTLSPFIQFSDRDGGDIYIKITSVVNGTLTQGENEIQSSETIPYYRNSYAPLNWTPPAGQSGLIDAFKIRVYDEDFDSEEEAVIQFQVEPNTPPMIVKIDTVAQSYEDYYHSIRLSSFRNNIEFTDEQGDELLLVVTEVVNGTLWKSSQPEYGQLDLPFRLSERNASFAWLPPPNEHGRIAAFKVKAADETEDSDIEHTVYFDVWSSNDPPYFDPISDPEPRIAVDTLHRIAITGVSPGPFEEDQVVTAKVTSSETTMIPNNQVDIQLGENGNADLIYLPVAGVEGTVELEITLTDSEGSTRSQKVYISFLKPDSPPVIEMEDSYDVFVGNPLQLIPDISDDRSIVTSRIVGDIPSWFEIDSRPKIASFSLSKHYSHYFKNGVINRATFNSTSGMLIDKRGDLLKSSGNVIRRVSSNGLTTTWVGNRQKSGFVDGTGRNAMFYGLTALAYDSQKDIVYALDAGNRAIRKINANGEVSTIFRVTDSREYGHMQSLTIDQEGDVYFGTGSPSHRIYKLDGNGNPQAYAGNGDNYATTLNGDKDELAIGQTYGMHAMGDDIYFTSFSLFGKISSNGQMTQIDLPDDFRSDGYETFLFKDGTNHLLLHKRAGSQVLRYNTTDGTFEIIIGKGDKPFEENIATEDFKPLAGGSYGYRITGATTWGQYQIFSLNYDNYSQLAVSRPYLDTIVTSPTAEDVGSYDVVVEASDIGGALTRKTITFNVFANNQITATNTDQQLLFEEGVTSVDINDIVLSGMAAGEKALVKLRLSNILSGELSSNSGNGEVFTSTTGVWEIEGTQTEVNQALAALSFRPDADFDLSSQIHVEIVNAGGGVPLNGLIELNVAPVNDPTRLSVEILDSAVVDIPYSFQLAVEDPDTEMFNVRINELPDWLNYQSTRWFESYAGAEQDTYWPNESDGNLTTALFDQPGKIFADTEGNLYVIERYKVKKISLGGEVSTYFHHQWSGSRDGTLEEAVFGTVSHMVFDQDNNMILTDHGSKRIRKITTDGIVTTLAGNGQTGFADDQNALNATFTSPNGLEFDDLGNLYILDRDVIRKLDTSGEVTTVAGNRYSGIGEGSALEVPFFTLRSIIRNTDGDMIIADDRTIRKWNLSTNQITVLVGNGINSCCNLNDDNENVYFRDLVDIRLDPEGNVYGIAGGKLFEVDFESGKTRELGNVNTSQRTGPVGETNIGNPAGIELLGGNLFLSDRDGHVIRRVYNKPGVLEGTPRPEDMGENVITYQFINGREEATEVSATITVFDNDFPHFKGIDSTYYFSEDEDLSLSHLQIVDETNDIFSLELKLKNRELGKLKMDGFEEFFDDSTESWNLSGDKDELNQALSALLYSPAEHSHAANTVELKSMRIDGDFQRFGQLILRGISVNDAPLIEDIEDQFMVSGAAALIDLQISDADADLPVVSAKELPEFLSLNRNINSKVSTFAGSLSGYNYGEEGLKDQIRLNQPNQLTFGPNGELISSDNKYIRIITDDSLKLYAQSRVQTYRNITEMLFRGQQLYVFDRTAIFTFDKEGTTNLVVGNVLSGDVDGAAADTRFSYLGSAAPGPGVRDMYLLDETTNKIKYLDDDLNVTTIFSAEDDAPVNIYDPVKIINKDGVYWILDRSQRLLSFTHEGELTERFSNESQISSTVWRSLSGLDIDASGNIILYGPNVMYMLDQQGRLVPLTSESGSGLEGETSVVNIGYIKDVLLTRDGEMIYSDRSVNNILRRVTYDFDYNISGTPADEDTGEYHLTVSADDGNEGGITEVGFKLIVAGSDKPSVTNLSQEITYEEDVDAVTIDPIVINTEDIDLQFEVAFLQNPFSSGNLRSSQADLEHIMNDPEKRLRGNADELNSILQSLYFEPALNNVEPTGITLSIRQTGGQLDSIGVLNLSVIPVNDRPEITLNISDTTAFVGAEIAIPIKATDIDGIHQLAGEHDLPEWLGYRTSTVGDQLLAGIPGKSGFTNGPALESSLLKPYRLDIDSYGNVYLLESGSYRVRRISTEGEVSVFAGIGVSGYKDGSAEIAQFGELADIIVDYKSNIYVSDPDNHIIRKITPDGQVTTFAGMGVPGYKDGDVSEALFGTLGEMAFDHNRTKLFVHDKGNRRVRTIDLFSGKVSTVSFDRYEWSTVTARGIAISPQNELYLKCDRTLVKSDLNGQNTTLVNSIYSHSTDGDLDRVSLNAMAMAFGSSGEIVLNDLEGRKLRFVQYNQLRTLLDETQDGYGSGYGDEVLIGSITDIVRLPDESFLMTDNVNHIIRRIEIYPKRLRGTPGLEDVGEYLATFAIVDTEGLKATREFRIEVRAEDTLHVSGLNSSMILNEDIDALDLPSIEIDDAAGQIVELNIEASVESGAFGVSPEEIIPYSNDENHWYATATVDSLNNLLADLKFFPADELSDNVLTTISLTRRGEHLSTKGYLNFIFREANQPPAYMGEAEYTVTAGETLDIRLLGLDPNGDSLAYAPLEVPGFVSADTVWYLQEYFAPLFSIHMSESMAEDHEVSARNMILNTSGDIIFSDNWKRQIRKLTTDFQLMTLAGNGASGKQDGTAMEASFADPSGLLYTADSALLIADMGNRNLRKLNRGGEVITVSGSGLFDSGNGIGSHVRYKGPSDLTLDMAGNIILSDFFAHNFRKIQPNSLVSSFAGMADHDGFANGLLNEARFNFPTDIKLYDGHLFLSDMTSLRFINDENKVQTIAGGEEAAYKDGALETARFEHLSGFVSLESGLFLVSDEGANAVRLISLKDSTVTTVASGIQGKSEGDALVAGFGVGNLVKMPDGEVVMFDTQNRRFLKLVRSTPTLRISPATSDSGVHELKVMISDGKGGSTEEVIRVNILEPNSPPEVITIPGITVVYQAEGFVSIPLFDYFSDEEDADSELTYEVISNSDNTVATSDVIDPADGILTLNIKNAGLATLEVKATDSHGASVSTSVTITINKAVGVITIANTEFVHDGDMKEVSVTTSPAELNYTVTYDGNDEAPSAIGVYEVQVSLDERNYMGTATGQLSIFNIAPEDLTLSGNSVYENREGTAVIGTLTTTDQNPTDTHTYSLSAGITDNALFAIEGNELSAIEAFDFETKDQYTVTVRVTDSQGALYEETFTISVLDVNDAPEAIMPDPIEVVKDLGTLSFTISGLTTGGDANQLLTLTTGTSGVLSGASATLGTDGSSAVITFESTVGAEGNGSILLTIKDDGGTENGGVDTYELEIPVTVLSANLTVTEAGNCGPGEVTLSASGADNYRWYSGPIGGEAISVGSELVTDISESTTYFVAGVFSDDESLLRVPVQASVFDLPEIPVIVNNNETLSVTELTGATYTWFRNGVEVPDESGSTYAPTESGDFTVMVTNENSCTAHSEPLSVIITGLETEVSSIEVVVYPVPSSDYIYLNFAETMRKGTVIRLLDNGGRELTKQVLSVPDNKATLDVRSYASGTHIIVVRDGNKLVRKRILIKK